MFIRSFIWRHAPTPGSLFDFFGYKSLSYVTRTLLGSYLFWWNSSKIKLTKWHREQLKEIDHLFALQDASRELVNAREVARAKGIGPLDPAYPDLLEFFPKKTFSNKR